MKTKQKQDLRAKSIPELSTEVEKRIEELFKIGIDIKNAKLKNTSSLRRKADELAVIKTILQEKIYQEKAKKI